MRTVFSRGRRGVWSAWSRRAAMGVGSALVVAAYALPASATPTNVAITSAANNVYQKSSSMAKNPADDNKMAIAFAKDSDPNADGLKTCYVNTTANGGGSWAQHAVVGAGAGNGLPVPPEIAGSDQVRCQSPGVAYSVDGATIQYVFQVVIFHSGAGGRFDFGFTYITHNTSSAFDAWSTPVRVNNPGYTNTAPAYDVGGDWYPSVSINTVPGSSTLDTIYVTWVRYTQSFDNRNVMLAQSTNGTSFTTVQVNPTVTGSENGTAANGGGGGAPSVVNQAGKVCVAWEDLTATFADFGLTMPSAVVSCATSAGGTTFNTPTNLGQAASSCASGGSFAFRCGNLQPAFSIASGPCPSGQTCTAGQVEVAWGDSAGGTLSLASSTDGGSTWGSAVSVATVASGHKQYNAWLSVNTGNSTGDGRLDLSYNDLDPTGTCSNANYTDTTGDGSRAVYHVSSTTLGANFNTKTPSQVNGACSDEGIFPGGLGFFPAKEGRVVSASTAITALGTVVAWTDTRNSPSESGIKKWDGYSANCTSGASCL